MSGELLRAAAFESDVVSQFRWYAEAASQEVAWRFFAAVDATLRDLAETPGLGRPRRFRHPALKDLHSFRVRPPFQAHLIFYRRTNETISAERLMHGRRDLARRLREPPEV